MSNDKLKAEDIFEKGVYLGCIEWEDCENYPIIKHPKFEKPICSFSGGLSMRMMVGSKIVFSKNRPEEVGKKITLDDPMLEGVYEGELKPNMDAVLAFDASVIKKLSTDEKKEKSIRVNENFGPMFNEGDKLIYIPETLNSLEFIPSGSIKIVGQIKLELEKDFVIDAGINAFIDKDKKDNYKVGDWVEAEIGEIDLV